MNKVRHFLDLDMWDLSTLRKILDKAETIKAGHSSGANFQNLVGKSLVCIFEKPSTRTRVSFQIGMQQLGGSVVIMDKAECHMGRSETIADTARVLSRYADAIMMRTDSPEKLRELADNATIPVINGLTDFSHPCQIMADIMTFEEYRGSIERAIVGWSGDGNNVVTSWIHAAVRFGFTFKIGCPESRQPPRDIIEWGLKEGGDIQIYKTAEEAITGADLVITDTWISMGDKNVEASGHILTSFQVDKTLMSKAAQDAVFMHCLPAHRGKEVTDEVIDGPQSVVWDEAENRLHAQKGILSWCLEKN